MPNGRSIGTNGAVNGAIMKARSSSGPGASAGAAKTATHTLDNVLAALLATGDFVAVCWQGDWQVQLDSPRASLVSLVLLSSAIISLAQSLIEFELILIVGQCTATNCLMTICKQPSNVLCAALQRPC